MPRITLVVALALSLSAGPSALAKAPACGERVQAFNTYDEMDANKKIVEKTSTFAPSEWSPDAGFEGLIVKAGEDPATKLEIEVKRAAKGKRPVKAKWSLTKWNERTDYLVAEAFHKGQKVFGDRHDFSGSYVIRLKLNGKVLCEDAPRKIVQGH